MKQPYHVHLGEGTVMMLAGLYDCWRRLESSSGGREARTSQESGAQERQGLQGVINTEEKELYSYTILTTNSSKPIQW